MVSFVAVLLAVALVGSRATAEHGKACNPEGGDKTCSPESPESPEDKHDTTSHLALATRVARTLQKKPTEQPTEQNCANEVGNSGGAQMYQGGPGGNGANHTENMCKCRNLCVRTKSCVGWTWSSSAFVNVVDGIAYNCWLRSSFTGWVDNCNGTCWSMYIKNGPADPYTFQNNGKGCPWVSLMWWRNKAWMRPDRPTEYAMVKNGKDKQCQCKEVPEGVGRWQTWQLVKVDDPTCETAFSPRDRVALLSQQTGKYLNAMGKANMGANIASLDDPQAMWRLNAYNLEQLQYVKFFAASDEDYDLQCRRVQLTSAKAGVKKATPWRVFRLAARQ